MKFNDMDPGPRGARRGPVTDLQNALIALRLRALGHGVGLLPKYGADGHLGQETWEALQWAAEEFRVDPLPAPRPGAVVYPDLVAAVFDPPRDDGDEAPVFVTPGCSGLVCGVYDGVEVFDFRAERVAAKPKVRMDARNRPVVRDPKKVRGIVLHQTAVKFSVSSAQLRAAGNNRGLALARRALNISTHATVFCEDPQGSHGPLLVLAAPLLWHMNHGNGLNGESLGLETDGLYPGITGQPRTVWGNKTPTPYMESTLLGARAGVHMLYEKGVEEGCPIEFFWAHRQSSATRRSDPGEWLWRNVAFWARDNLKLKLQPDAKWGTGAPIPTEWGGSARY